jgi:hypothetical protein
VESGHKTTTIRLGHRAYPKGPAKLVSSNREVPIEIIEIRHTCLNALSEHEAIEDGYANTGALYSDLQRFYPDITENHAITIVRFRLK